MDNSSFDRSNKGLFVSMKIAVKQDLVRHSDRLVFPEFFVTCCLHGLEHGLVRLHDDIPFRVDVEELIHHLSLLSPGLGLVDGLLHVLGDGLLVGHSLELPRLRQLPLGGRVLHLGPCLTAFI